jgi:hypothetical protein
MDNRSSVMPEDHQYEESPECGGWYRGEVDRFASIAVVRHCSSKRMNYWEGQLIESFLDVLKRQSSL